jgi:hypothetical protein
MVDEVQSMTAAGDSQTVICGRPDLPYVTILCRHVAVLIPNRYRIHGKFNTYNNYLINYIFKLFSLDGSSAKKVLAFKKKENYANRFSRTSNITVTKIASPFNNIIGIERYAKRVTLENFHRPSGKIRTPCKIAIITIKKYLLLKKTTQYNVLKINKNYYIRKNCSFQVDILSQELL